MMAKLKEFYGDRFDDIVSIVEVTEDDYISSKYKKVGSKYLLTSS